MLKGWQKLVEDLVGHQGWEALLYRHFQSGRLLHPYPGLKPRAESSSPFGTKTDVRAPVRKIEATPQPFQAFEQEDSLPDVAPRFTLPPAQNRPRKRGSAPQEKSASREHDLVAAMPPW